MPSNIMRARPPTTGSIAVVVKGYPRLSETFIAQELKALEERGLRLRIYSLRHPYDRVAHPIHGEIGAPVTYLPEYLHNDPRRVGRGWRTARRKTGYRKAALLFKRDLWRDISRNRLRRFGQACVLAAELPSDVRALYAHFLHTPSSVARYTAHMCGLPLAISAHAKDIWTTPDWEILGKAVDASWITTCTQAGATHLAKITADSGKIRLARHGLDLDRFSAAPRSGSHKDGTNPDDPVLILSVGRLVEKKGYADLLHALSRLPDTLNWRFVHIGGGELRDRLTEQAHKLHLAARIEWLASQPQTIVLEWLRRADLFVLASRIAAGGDRDGLPNVLMEAQSQSVPCIATVVSGIPELIETGTTGLLVPPADPDSLAEAIQRLIRAPDERARLGAAGERRVRTGFSMNTGADQLAGWLLEMLPTAAATV